MAQEYVNKLKDKINTTYSVIKVYKNWHHVLTKYMHPSDSLVLVLRNGETRIKLHKNELGLAFCLARILANGAIYNENKILLYKGLAFKMYETKTDIYSICEIFVNQVYNKFDFKNKVVVDIGAYIGDSSIFFAWKGAKKIFSFEPNPEVFKTLIVNVRLNNFENIINTYNVAVGKEGFVKLYVPNSPHGATVCLKEHLLNELGAPKVFRIKSLSIQDVLLLEDSIDIMKIDCEGCEYDILKDLVRANLSKRIKEGVILELHKLNSIYTIKYGLKLLKMSGFKKINIKHVSETLTFAWAFK